MSRASSLWEWLLLLICHRLTGIWEGTFAPHAAVQSQGCRSPLAFAFNSVNTCWLFSVKKNCQRAYWKSTVKGYFRFDIYQKKGWWRHWRQMAIWVIRTIKKKDGIWYSKEREKKDGMKVMEKSGKSELGEAAVRVSGGHHEEAERCHRMKQHRRSPSLSPMRNKKHPPKPEIKTHGHGWIAGNNLSTMRI